MTAAANCRGNRVKHRGSRKHIKATEKNFVAAENILRQQRQISWQQKKQVSWHQQNVVVAAKCRGSRKMPWQEKVRNRWFNSMSKSKLPITTCHRDRGQLFVLHFLQHMHLSD